MKKKKRARSVGVELEMEYKEYAHKLNKEEREWVEQFYYEEYGNGMYHTEDPILVTEEQLKEARRNHNSIHRDAFNAARKAGQLEELSDEDRQFMEDASDEWDWQNAFKTMGYEAAVNIIFNQTAKELQVIDTKTTLIRFYVKMERLRREKFNDDRTKRKRKNDGK